MLGDKADVQSEAAIFAVERRDKFESRDKKSWSFGGRFQLERSLAGQ